jgi:hypothetical protein
VFVIDREGVVRAFDDLRSPGMLGAIPEPLDARFAALFAAAGVTYAP